ncbi:hypothetical protein PYJP_12760 [Pyrofollis japonicus]|uniref:hypothetical protein n=1 Tax=Pyrofollis japonicus TaxID=3060460 RepID=UPI00295A8707|nr:hypothetical protein [Pyrofollis japonicus]BEP17924.1 hypothetical protein PYJP_12760 [Pyrofollis japonicus]
MVVNEAAIGKRVVREILAWFTISSISLALSGSIASYFAGKALESTCILETLFNVFSALFGAIWFLISAILTYSIWRLLRKYMLLPSPYERLRELDEEKTAQLIKDVVSLYRGYRLHLAVVGALLTITGAIGTILAIREYIAEKTYESLIKFAAATVYLFYGLLELYLEKRTICRRLAKAQQLEDLLSELIK